MQSYREPPYITRVVNLSSALAKPLSTSQEHCKSLHTMLGSIHRSEDVSSHTNYRYLSTVSRSNRMHRRDVFERKVGFNSAYVSCMHDVVIFLWICCSCVSILENTR